MMKIAVTAASGRLGRAILKALSQDIGADRVVGIARDPDRIDVGEIDKRQGDYNSVTDFVPAFRGIDATIMISAPVTPGTDRVAMHRNVIEAAKRAGVRKLVYTSIIGNGKEEGTLFAETQRINRQTEADLQQSGLEWVIGRNGLYLELDLKHIIRAHETGVYQNNGGAGRCGYITVDELACAYAKMATEDRHNGRIYNLVGETMSQAELVELACEVFGLNVEYQTIGVEENIARFMQDATIAARGEPVARMLAGCFQCMEKGAFDVPSDYEAATGRPCKTILQQMEELRTRQERCGDFFYTEGGS